MNITPHTFLSAGTKVQVQNKRGEVVKYDIKKDQFGAPINVHTVKLTEVFSHRIGQTQVYKPLNKVKIQECNYAFIEVIGNN
ncbi:MAG: hypothetical protein WC567_03880 [Kiritimatiellia bacterium]|jgi:hypothetical protein